ncbi:sigma-54 interaction domain-containing protein [Brassicibacter mesophilus]|uniref:sigma-54 interaction domain-containing protein n=1 Tax=Brassicibacter mesophilus TaxID=745119 RepID=UPI003D199B88
MVPKHSVLIVAYQKNTLKRLVKQLQEIGFLNYFNLEGRTVDELFLSIAKGYDLIVLSSKVIYPMVKPYLPEKTPYIIAKRTINYANIQDLLAIPKGMKVLLVSDLKEASEETIVTLKEAGIDYDFVPYYPGASYDSNIRIAVTVGEPQLVPPDIEREIDIGNRVIDISTITEILEHFKASNDTFNQLSARFMQSLVYITEKLSDEIFQSNFLRKSLEGIINSIDDSVLVFSKEGIIKSVNQRALDIIKLPNENVLDKPANEVIDHSLIEKLRNLEVDEDNFVEYNQVIYYIRKKKILIEDKLFGHLYLFRKADEIQKIEYNYRLKTQKKNLVTRYTFKDLKTQNSSVLELIKIAKKLAKSSSTILILGETGTGKEILAQAIHNASPRNKYPFVGVNFAAISESLTESELFGYEEGAFTGAKKGGHMGLFEQAHKGTIFFDEIGDASMMIQNRLLRVLQEKQMMRVGGDNLITLDIRVIAATNRNLLEMAKENTFREDLYYRLNVLPLYLIPLRKRPEDIPLLVNMYVDKFTKELKREPFQLSKTALKTMLDYNWPGNIRELENVIEYLAHIADSVVFKEQLPFLNTQYAFTGINDRNVHDHEKKLSEFEKKGFIEEMMEILSYLSGEGRPSCGRHAILEHMEMVGFSLSEQQLRYRQELLSNDEYIITGRGRKGSSISSKGRSLLEYYNKHYI